MVLANLLKTRYREEGREVGKEEGRGEAQAEWEAWYERMQQAAGAGEPFDEPPPTRSGRPRPWETDPASRPCPSAPHSMAPPQEEPPCR